MKRITLLLLALLMVLSMVPTVSAAEYTPIELDFDVSSSGNGWSYDAETVTLTLDNYYFPMDENATAAWIEFDDAPENFTIYLTPGSVNAFPIYSGSCAIRGSGSLSMYLCYSSLDLDCDSFSCGAFYGEFLTIRGGNVSFERTKATSNITIYDGTVNITKLDVYSLEIFGGTVTTGEAHNCNGLGLGYTTLKVSGGKLIIDSSLSEETYPFSFIFYNDGQPDFQNRVQTFLENMGTFVDAAGNPLEFRFFSEEGDAFHEDNFYCQAVATDAAGNPPSSVIVSPRGTFLDTVSGEYYYEPVIWAVKNSITTGLTPTVFGVDENCTRAQFVTFLWRAAGSPEPTAVSNTFADVEEGQFYSKAVLWAVENGITTGLSANKFGVNEPCTRAQVVTFLHRYAGSSEPTITENPFTDAEAGQFYSVPILWAVENGITTGLSPTVFGVNTPCSRAQVVTFLYRAVA